jgi:hypothetical protein
VILRLPIKRTVSFSDEKTVTASVRLKESARDKLAASAKSRRRTVSQLVGFGVDHWLKTGADKKLPD